MLIAISGPSKSGKTVFVRSIIGPDNLIAVTGAGATSSDDLWRRVFHQIGTPIPKSFATSASTTATLNAKAGASGSAFVAKVQGEAGVAAAIASGSHDSVEHQTDALQLLIKELAGTGMVLFIDDFHYLPAEVQAEIANQIKDAISYDVKIVCASVPYHSEDVLRANADLRGRIVTIDFDYWDPTTLAQIAELGFNELNVTVSEERIRAFAAEAAGSPQLMQSICLNACFEGGHRDRSDAPTLMSGEAKFFSDVCSRAAMSADYSATLERLREGPKTRGTERIPHELAEGGHGDVYTIILKAMVLDPPTLHFRYPILQERIRSVCRSSVPVGSSVTGACFQIAALANNGARTIMEWDPEEDVLNIRDPYLLFYMRWCGALR